MSISRRQKVKRVNSIIKTDSEIQEEKCKKLTDLYRDAWNEILSYLKYSFDFFSITMISKQIRNEIMHNNKNFQTDNIRFYFKEKKSKLELTQDCTISKYKKNLLSFFKNIDVILPFVKNLFIIQECPTFNDLTPIPNRITKLSIDMKKENNFFTGKNLYKYKNIKWLRVSKCAVFKATHLPSSLKKLVVENCKKFLGNRLPNTIKSLHILNPSERECKSLIIPDSVTSLLITGRCYYRFEKEDKLIIHVPSSVTKLTFCSRIRGGYFPNYIFKKLKIIGCWTKRFRERTLPNTITDLTIINCQKFEWFIFPSSLLNLSLHDCDNIFNLSILNTNLLKPIERISISRSTLRFIGFITDVIYIDKRIKVTSLQELINKKEKFNHKPSELRKRKYVKYKLK